MKAGGTLFARERLLVLAVTAIVSGRAVAADWPNFRGPNRNGISQEKLLVGPSTAIEQLWTKWIGPSCSSVAISGGRLYTMTNTGKTDDEKTHQDVVYCFDAPTGNEIWRHSYKCGINFKSNTPEGPFASPTVDANSVYTFSRKGDLYCLDAGSGKVRWYKDVKEQVGMNMPFQGGFAGSPLIAGDMLILNAGDAGTAFNKHTGKVIWKSNAEVAAQATPVLFEAGREQRLAMFSGIGLVGVRLSDGKRLWTFPWPTKYKTNVADPIVVGDKAFISTWYKMGCVLLNISGPEPQVIWQNKDMHNHYSTCVLWQGCLYGFDVDTLKCMDFETGRVKWQRKGGFGRGQFIMVDEKLVVLTEKGKLQIGDASPQGFEPILEAQVIEGRCFTGPVLSGGRIYVRNLTGDLVCVELKQAKSKDG
ncbi:MAG: PQQ-binding-like beta-propeller repeat protein [Planctomycetota bacterium]|jgi:outer membrane protein assembly factor BamB